MEYNPDRAGDQTGRLTSHVRECEDFENLVRVLAVKHQLNEDIYYDIATKSRFGDAENAQLDVCGKHLVAGREGRTDPQFELYLGSLYTRYQSSGLPEELITLFKQLTGAVQVRYDDTYKLQCNNLIAYFDDLPSLEAVDQELVIDAMRKAKQGGQGLRLVLALRPSFRFGEGSTSILDSDNGFGAGKFVEVIIIV